MIIGISGKIGSGKDTLGLIIQYLTEVDLDNDSTTLDEFKNDLSMGYRSNFQIRKSAENVKLITSIIIGCSIDDLENREFKNTELPENFWYYESSIVSGRIYLDDYKLLNENKKQYWDILVKPTPRNIMISVGNDFGRNMIHRDVWINSLLSEYKPVNDEKRFSLGNVLDYSDCDFPNWIITDIRYKNEVDKIHKRKGIVIRINRDYSLIYPEQYSRFEKSKFFSKDDNSFINYLKSTNLKSDLELYNVLVSESETSLDDFTAFDATISNNGDIKNLTKQTLTILKFFNV